MASPIFIALVALSVCLSVGAVVTFFVSALQVLGFSLSEIVAAVLFSVFLGATLSVITPVRLWRNFRSLAAVCFIAIWIFCRSRLVFSGGTSTVVFVVVCACFMMFTVQAGLLWRRRRELEYGDQGVG